MPTSFHIDSEHGVAYARTLGKTSSGELLESFVALLRHPDYSPGMRLLLDMREVTPSLFQRDILRIGQHIRSHWDEIGTLKMAVVVPKASSFGMARELEAGVDGSSVEMGVFRGVREAREWLGLAGEGVPSTDGGDAVAG
jgi:hypothetical protein